RADKIPQVGADTCFTFLSEVGMGNRQTKRMSEKGRHGKPVRQCTHHARFCKRPQETDALYLFKKQVGAQVQKQHEKQKSAGEIFVSTKSGSFGFHTSGT